MRRLWKSHRWLDLVVGAGAAIAMLNVHDVQDGPVRAVQLVVLFGLALTVITTIRFIVDPETEVRSTNAAWVGTAIGVGALIPAPVRAVNDSAMWRKLDTGSIAYIPPLTGGRRESFQESSVHLGSRFCGTLEACGCVV